VAFDLKRHAWFTEFKNKGRIFQLIKPTTYMNRSGRAIRHWMEKGKIPLENVIVLVDDIHLPFGKIRIRGNGSHGGHNGLEDIIYTLGTKEFTRLRFGIGSEFHTGGQVDYVLGEWTVEQEDLLPPLLKKSADAAISFGMSGLKETMNRFSS
jgi:PTH1 family peptidyl-tRNA hydrolase